MRYEDLIPITGHVCIVDDDVQRRQLLREVLQNEGYGVLETDDGEAALAELRTNTHHLIVLLDQAMGKDVLQAVAADRHLETQHAYILMCAQGGCSPELEELIARLAVVVVPKPCDLEILLARVAEAACRLEQPPGTFSEY